MKHINSKEDMFIHNLNNLPDEYINIVKLLERRIGTDNNVLTLFELRDKLTTKCFCLLKSKNMK